MRRTGPLLSLLAATALLSAEPPAAPAPTGEVRTLAGTAYKGEVRRVTDQEIQIATAEKEVVLPTADVIGVDLQGPKPPPNLPFLLLKLNDGSLLRCQAVGLQGKTVTARLFTGAALEVPLTAVHYLLCEAQEEKNRQDLEALVTKRSPVDQLRLMSRDGSAVNTFEGFLGEADAKGQTLQFKPEDGEQVNVALARVRGLVFSRKPEALGGPAVARVVDVYQDVILATKVQTTPEGFQVTTPAGATLSLPRPLVQKFDFSLGKLAYLSDLDPLRVEEAPILADLWHYRRDKSLEGGPLSLGRKIYAKGLAVHSRTVLEYDVSGYNLFRCVVGIDDAVTGPAHAIVSVHGDGKELFSTAVSGKDKQARDLELKVAGVQRLRLTVDYGEDLDLGDHVIFADARVMK
jgi:hypothetical protein